MGQILAIAWLRRRLFVNRLRREGGVFGNAAGVLTLLLTLFFSILLATGLFVLARRGVAETDGPWLRMAWLGAFWAAFVFGVVMPLVLATGSGGIEPSRYLLYPIGRKKLFAIHWGAAFLSPDHLFYYPALAATLVAGVLMPGEAVALGLAFHAVVVVVVVSWAQAVFAALQGILNHRRTRELVGLVGFSALVLAGFAPAFLAHVAEQSSEERVVAFVRGLGGIASVLPPNLAADGLVAAQEGSGGAALRALLWLVVWAGGGILAASLAFDRIALRSREGRGEAGTARDGEVPSRFDVTAALPFLPADVLAVASKELRYLKRSAIGKFNLVMNAVFVAMVALVLLPQVSASPLGVESEELGLYGMLWYAVLFSNNFVSNSVGWEGTGFKAYLLSPVRFQRIVVGKNLGIWTYNAAMLAISLVAWSAMVEAPGPAVLLGAVLLFAGTQVLFVTAGNFLSISFPVARNISSMKCTPAAPAILLSLLTSLGIAVPALFAVVAPVLVGAPWARPLFLLAYFGASLLVYRISLGPVAELFARRKDRILEALEGACD